MICLRCHTRLEPDVEKCTQWGQWLNADEESISDFMNEDVPDWRGK